MKRLMIINETNLNDGLMEYELKNGWYLYRLNFDGAIAEREFKVKQDATIIGKILKDEVIKFRNMPKAEREFLERQKNENNGLHKDKGVG